MSGEVGRRRSRRIAEATPGLPESVQLASLFYAKPRGDKAGAAGGGRAFRLHGRSLRVLHSAPNVYLVEDFLTEAEVQHFSRICGQATFNRSYTDDDDGNRVVSEERTSTFFWLPKAGDAQSRAVEARAAELLGLVAHNTEPLQIVSYTEGQHFDVHHDAGTLDEDTGEVDGPCVPRRVATIFAYLNSLPEGEGHTEFPELGISVRPRRGAAVLFPNLTAAGVPEPRTVHRACPVSGGHRKFGMNVWVTDSNLSGLALLPKKVRVGSKGAPAGGAEDKENRGGGKRQKKGAGKGRGKRAKAAAGAAEAPDGDARDIVRRHHIPWEADSG